MRFLSLLLTTALIVPCTLPAAENTAPPPPPQRLLADSALAGWTFLSPDPTALSSVSSLAADGVLTLAGAPLGYLQSTATYTNFHLHAEWRWTAKPGNSGILVHIATGPLDRHLWPRCLQIQTKHTHAGDLLPMAGATFAEALSTPPDAPTPLLTHVAADSENPVGEWNTCDIVCRDGTVEVTVNGVLQNRITRSNPAAGHIGFQFEGTPYALRRLSIEPLLSRH
ncbi:DUF1080 domain-containing protein [Horticoccus luteus]|uniref:DUF1080 domain-containing protein n=1 Tax=Horticoccus luteus TaxID=2862869 RepID=A0A8F9TWB9_9BACT|nr:DUF1080 domain-containing protein [Horticoccus luteus]QYM79206.1 DUF1080 domain-containing protein [Horticoccus luteus]